MEFPHLKDTQFPILGNVDVYKYKNLFNYARWEGKVSFKLLNVLWNSNYADVPYFDTVEKRDEWFDSKSGYAGILDTLFNTTPDGKIKIPIPYNDAYRYNYLVVDMPVQTSANEKLNYEDTNIRISRWFYFIEDMTQLSPSTTEMQISVDYWTTFIHSVDIPYLMLERGHAPMMQTDVETYLANPLANNEYLLADDFNYGTTDVISTMNYIPIGNGTKYVLFCAPYERNDFDLFGAVNYSGNSTRPTYSNADDITGMQNNWGYQYNVNNYEWKYGGVDYSNAQLPIKNRIQTGILNGCECFAIEGTQAREFFNKMAKECVHFIHGIQAMFILSEELFTRTTSFEFKGYTLYIADRKHNHIDFNFSKEQFNFPSKYADITKLYTFPYSSLEITDDNGHTFNARIENCGNVKVQEQVSLVYPFLNYNVFVTGINGNGSTSYVWKSVQGDNYGETMWESDFSKFMMNWEVPTYSIYVGSEAEFAVNNNINTQAERARAIMEYQNAMRLNNTSKENVDDIQNTSYANIRSLTNTVYNNEMRTQAGIVDNMENTRDTNDGIIKTLQYGTNGFYQKTKDAGIQKVSDSFAADNGFIGDATALSVDYISATSINNSSAAIAGGWIGGLTQFGSAGASAIGSSSAKGAIGTTVGGAINGIGTVAQGYVQADVVQQNSVALITKDSSVAIRNQNYNNDKFTIELTYTNDIYNTKKAYSEDLIDEQNRLLEETTLKFSDATTGINPLNSDALRDVQQDNANDMTHTEKNNALYSRNALMRNEKAKLVQKQLEIDSMYKNVGLQKPTTYGKYSGDVSPDAYTRRGVRLNIRTQTKAAIAQAGDAFLRFGYALHRVWDMSNGFHYGKEFTFWKAEDIWINDGSGVANAATNVIGDILLKGVTVWRNPDKIGLVGIYDNL